MSDNVPHHVSMSVLWFQVDCHSTINQISNDGKGSATSTHSLDRKKHEKNIRNFILEKAPALGGEENSFLLNMLVKIRIKQSRTCQIVSEPHESSGGMTAYSSHGNDTEQIVWAAEYPHSILGKAVISDTFITCTA